MTLAETADTLIASRRSDFHLHTCASDAAAECTPANIVAVARGLGMTQLGFTDHAYACGANAPGASHTDGKYLQDYLRVCDQIRSIDSPLELYVSWEVDYFDGGFYSFDPDSHLDDLDYVLLAHHAWRHMQGRSPEELAAYLLRIYLEMAQEPYAHIIAHPFYVPRPPENHGAVLSRITDAQFREIFQAMRENGKAAEITTYQFSADYRDVEQARRMYSAARETGVKFVLDSDAHSLAEVGDGLRCVHVLRSLGFTDRDFVDYAGLLALKTA
jgi:histidinol phosphatase-like PHP family hydrolase